VKKADFASESKRKAPNKEIQQKIMETVSVNRQTSEEKGQQHLRLTQFAMIKFSVGEIETATASTHSSNFTIDKELWNISDDF